MWVAGKLLHKLLQYMMTLNQYNIALQVGNVYTH